LKESDLIAQLQAKDSSALEELIQIYSSYVGTIVRNIIGQKFTEADVEEITADVFLAVWTHADHLKSGKVKAYLGAIARNKAKNRFRNYQETISFEDIIDIPTQDNTESKIDQKFLEEALGNAMDKLSAKDREILVRHYYYYENVKKIAKEMHMKDSAVKMRLSLAREKLKRELVEEGFYYEDSPELKQIDFALFT